MTRSNLSIYGQEVHPQDYVIPIEVKIAKQSHTHGEPFHMINHCGSKILKSFEDMHEHTI